MYIHFGTVNRTGVNPTFLNGLEGTASVGQARVVEIGSNSITFDKITANYQKDIDVNNDLDIIFGEWSRDVDTDHEDFTEQSYTLEMGQENLTVHRDEHENLLPNPVDKGGYCYAEGNYLNTLSLNLPLTDKATMSMAFVGTDTRPETLRRLEWGGSEDNPGGGNLTPANEPVDPDEVEAFSTVADIARLRLENIDNNGLLTDFKSVTLTVNNNVTGEKVLRNLGPKYINYGTFAVTLEAQAIFDDARICRAIRENEVVSMDFALQNDEFLMVVDIPNMTLSGGNKDFPTDETVLINQTGTAFGKPGIMPHSLSITVFPKALVQNYSVSQRPASVVKE